MEGKAREVFIMCMSISTLADRGGEGIDGLGIYDLFHLLLIQKSLEMRSTRLSRSVSNAERRKEIRATPDFMKEFQQRKQRTSSKGTAGMSNCTIHTPRLATPIWEWPGNEVTILH